MVGHQYDASTASIYFEALGPGNTLVICRMDPNTGSFEPLWADNPPSAITFMSMVFDPAHQRFFVFGGQNLENFQLPDDVWVLDLLPTRKWSHWTPSGESPKGRIGGALVIDAARNRLLLLGGLANVNPGVWALSLDDTTWPSSPMSRSPVTPTPTEWFWTRQATACSPFIPPVTCGCSRFAPTNGPSRRSRDRVRAAGFSSRSSSTRPAIACW